MECIIRGNQTILGILGSPKGQEGALRPIRYQIALPVAEGVLLLNTLTRELLLLAPEEYAKADTLDYLRQHWFTLPERDDERELVELVRWVRNTMRKKTDRISAFTVLTTTDCNARCFYCYEKGCKKVDMRPETAEKVADHILRKSGGKQVTLRWFGGEPMMNHPAIDRICDRLRAENVPFRSQMTSNAYLFTDELVARAVERWELKDIQITLDGTQEVYDRSKAYVRPEGSPYQRVLANVERLLAAGVRVALRLNLGLHNMEDLLALVRQLGERFPEKKGLRVYVSLLFDTEKSREQMHPDREWEALYMAQTRLEDALVGCGLAAQGLHRLPRDNKTYYCMADSGKSELILPDGRIGLCEHHTDDETIGHIDSPERDKAVIASWQERFDPIPECDDCPHYPGCLELKKCSGRIGCFEQSRQAKLAGIHRAMLQEYGLWQLSRADAQDPAEEPELPATC